MYQGKLTDFPDTPFNRNRLPADFRTWLINTQSLTRILQSLCGDQFQIKLILQTRKLPEREESLLLNERKNKRMLIRQVCLCDKDIPLVFARTIIPEETLSGKYSALAHLRTRSLGATLFNDPSCYLKQRWFSQLTALHPLYSAAVQQLNKKPKRIWGRRTLFYLGGNKPILVSEFFLPTLLNKKYAD